jgi:aspartate ammonia-lyase
MAIADDVRIDSVQSANVATRVEHDLLGSRELPAKALFGIHTARALENFPVRDRRLGEIIEFCRALILVKQAAARANVDCGVLDPELGESIATACDLLVGDPVLLRESFVLPVLQGGAGTSTNMNANEVVANKALETMGGKPGEYGHCHPNDHVNRSQSTNDVYPTALQIALRLRSAAVEEGLTALASALEEVAEGNTAIPKLGRTQLRDAVPMSVDQEFLAWADGFRRSAVEVEAVAEGGLRQVNLGGTAIGTGLAAPDGFAELAVSYLEAACGLDLERAVRPVSATTDTSGLLAYSATLRSAAIRIAKLSNDLRLLSSGPRAGLGELLLPAVQAGSSMMPGKINPVVPEYANQLCFRIHGLDHTVVLALDAAQLQLSAMLPAAADGLFEAQDLLRLACGSLVERCVRGIEVNQIRMGEYAADGLGELTSAAAILGYETGSALLNEADRAGIAPVEAVRRKEAEACKEVLTRADPER